MGVSLVSNPPYNMRWDVPALAGFMPQYAGHTIPPKSNANYAFILSGLSLIDSKAVFLLPNGVLSSGTKEETAIRQELIMDNLISAVITLPDSMFESTSIPVCIILLDRNKQTRKIEMIDMRGLAEKEVRDQKGQFGGNSHTGRTYHKEVNVLSAESMSRAVEAIKNLLDIPGFCKAVMPNAIEKNGWQLSPSRYIDQELPEVTHRPFKDIADDYNRIIGQKNSIRIKMNRTAAKRLGYDCLDTEKTDISQSFEVVGQKADKEAFIRFSADDGIEIKCSTKDGIPELIIMFLNYWRQELIRLNNEENRLLAEFRDALLPELMSGKIDLGKGSDGQ